MFKSLYNFINLKQLLIFIYISFRNECCMPNLILLNPLKRAGGPRSIFTFFSFLTEENGSCQKLFSEWKNIVFIQSYRILKPRKIIQLQCLKLGSYILGTKTKTFDWADFLFIPQKWKLYRILKIPNPHFSSILAYKQLPKFDIFTSGA